MNWERGLSALGVLLLLVCLWLVHDMSDKLDTMEPHLYGQTLEGGGVTTERWVLPNGEPEPREAFIQRHMASERAFLAAKGE